MAPYASMSFLKGTASSDLALIINPIGNSARDPNPHFVISTLFQLYGFRMLKGAFHLMCNTLINIFMVKF